MNEGSKPEMNDSRLRKTLGKSSMKTGSHVVDSLPWVIFPSNKWIKRWDLTVLFCLFLIAFILPYQLGVSGGYLLLTSIPWLVFNILINAVFFVDTFLYFFRAYYTRDGQLVLNLRRIRRGYLRTLFIPNFLSVLPFTLVFYIYGKQLMDDLQNTTDKDRQTLTFIQLAGLLKLIRLFRVRQILASSHTITNFRQTHDSQTIELFKFVWLIVVVSHWFACLWAFVAYMEARSLAEGLLELNQWIGYWHNNYYVDGGLDPIGFKNSVDRYVLSLFWAIQTITSIGYGNIVPVTRAEWFVSCFLMLCAGVMWAYVIGGLVGVAAGMGARQEAYLTRNDQANTMIRGFVDPERNEGNSDNGIEGHGVAKQIRKYIHGQYIKSLNTACVTSLEEMFPVLETLTPDLKQKSTILLLDQILQAIPYIDLSYMSPDDLYEVAKSCLLLEFPAGDTVKTGGIPGSLGQGIFIMKQGSALVHTKSFRKKYRTSLVPAGTAIGVGEVLLADDHPASQEAIYFLTFSKVVFVPRATVLEALEKCPRAWKECACWHYAKTLLLWGQPSDEQERRKGFDKGENYEEDNAALIPE